MQSKIEGILISKINFRERDIIGKVLLRSGHAVSVAFYGGRGGGKKNKSSTLELGYMLKIELAHSSKNSDMYSAKEWIPIWTYSKIRANYKAFCIMCFYIEVVAKICTFDDLHDEHRISAGEFQGPFRVLSNGIFYLEQGLQDDHNLASGSVAWFLGKLLLEQGFFPERKYCILCHTPFGGQIRPYILLPEHGGVGCFNCINREDLKINSALNVNHSKTNILSFLETVWTRTYPNLYAESSPVDPAMGRMLFQYFCAQHQFEATHFKTYSDTLF
ncbi:MAG: hypothetical protein ISR65_11940 [Bacteriovoracaceae bacterium]|nr:hypothetical protein [Bacteriovoracaceae bacterium]